MPAILSDCIVIGCIPTNSDNTTRIVLVDRMEGSRYCSQRYVTGRHTNGATEWASGRYFTDFEKAVADMIERAKNG